MPDITLKDARGMLEIVIGPEEIVAKVPEWTFGGLPALLSAHGLSAIPPLPSQDTLLRAQEQKKALIFRIGRDGSGKDVTLLRLKELFGELIYSSWFLKKPPPFAVEPLPVGWALVDLDLLPGSTEKTFQEQEALTKEKGARLKSPVADAYDLLVTYKVTGKFYRGVPLNGRTGAVFSGEPVKICHFDKGGMCISTGWGGTVKHVEIGATTELL